jgi:cytoskeleton protein RodZ
MALEAAGIGARLRAGREKLGLTVLQVAERIHTDPKIVEAIESDNYAALGAPVYARGHIRHYAELVGESANELIALYSDLGKVGQPDLTQIVKAPAGHESNKLVAPALIVIAVFAIAGAVWWVSALSKKKPQLSETHVVGEEQPASSSSNESSSAGASPGTSAAPAAATGPGVGNGNAGPVQTRAPSGAGAAASGATGRPTPSATLPPGSPGRQGAAGTPPTSGPAAPSSTRVASAGPTGATPPTSGSPAPTGAVARNQAQVTLRYSADSWTEVYDSTGARLFYDVGSANSVQTVVGTPPLRVVLGNASGVAVEFNGRSTPIAKLAHPDGSVQFSISRSGRVIRAKPVADGG